MASSTSSPLRLLYDLRVRAVLYQVVAVALVLGVGFYLFGTVSRKLADQNIATGFDYLSRPAGFVISQSFISYDSGNTYGRAILVGLLNTVWVSVFAVILSSVLGLVVGLARLSRNPLLSFLALLYVEALRNVPLLLYLFLWYALIVAVFPPVREAWQILPDVFLSNGGLTRREVRKQYIFTFGTFRERDIKRVQRGDLAADAEALPEATVRELPQKAAS